MQQSQIQGTQRFTFGQVTDTEYVSFQIVSSQKILMYNPFRFDLKLTIFKSHEGYEQVGTTFDIPNQGKILIGRKKKIQKQLPKNITPYYLKGQTISERHFSVDNNHVLRDEGSKLGTYIWVDQSKPRKVQIGDIYQIGRNIMKITKLNGLPRPCIQFMFNEKSYRLQQKLFLIGSNKKCDIVLQSLNVYQVCINPINLSITSFLDEQDASSNGGLWFKVKGQTLLQNNDLIYVQPYIFKVIS